MTISGVHLTTQDMEAFVIIIGRLFTRKNSVINFMFQNGKALLFVQSAVDCVTKNVAWKTDFARRLRLPQLLSF